MKKPACDFSQAGFKVEAAGIAPAICVAQLQSQHSACVNQGSQWLRIGCADLALIELLSKWSTLPPYITQAIMALVKTSPPKG